MRVDDRAEARVLDVVRGERLRRDEAAHAFVLASGAGVEVLQAFADRLIDAVVVADVEVEEGEVDDRSPVATVERVALLHVEGARDDAAALVFARDDPREALGEARA